LNAAYRERDIAYSHSNDLAEQHVANNILAAKALYRKRFDFDERTAAAV